MLKRITELSNDLTSEIDQCDPEGIVRLLCQSDAQLFAGWRNHPSIYDPTILRKIDSLAVKASQLLQDNEKTGANNVFVFTGCGTSGRIAWVCSRSFNRLQQHFKKKPCFRYLEAGGDKALIVGDELPEDDPPRGAQDLKNVSSGADHVILVGITCGLSAPYVAGQIDHAMKQENLTAVLIGFNPVESARDAVIEKWDKTCKETFLKLQDLEKTSDKGVILNPIVGPEPITGSSRMKGGSMTAILLNTVFSLALARAYSIPLSQLLGIPDSYLPGHIPIPGSSGSDVTVNGTETEGNSCYMLSQGEREVALMVDAFQATYTAAYRPTSGIASLMGTAGRCLRQSQGGHVYYLGTQLLGIVGFVDSSEMVATFGSSPHEFRGFVQGGWHTCQNREGDLSKEGVLFQISIADFERDIVPTLSSRDCVIWVQGVGVGFLDEEAAAVGTVMEKVFESPAQCCLLVVSARGQTPPPQISDHRFITRALIEIPHFGLAEKEPVFAAFALKLVLNAISTGANILKGRVYENTMINLTVANDKLYYRSISIIAELCRVSSEEAERALVKAIHREDEISKQLLLPISEHIKAAAKKNMVVPLAAVLASRECSVQKALSVFSSSGSNNFSLRTIVQDSSARTTTAK